jgi:hypothetical protein
MKIDARRPASTLPITISMDLPWSVHWPWLGYHGEGVREWRVDIGTTNVDFMYVGMNYGHQPVG